MCPVQTARIASTSTEQVDAATNILPQSIHNSCLISNEQVISFLRGRAMRLLGFVSLLPAAIFVPTVLTIIFMSQRKKWLRRRLRRSRMAAVNQSIAAATSQSGAPEPAPGAYAAELASALADLRGDPVPRPALGGHNGL